MQIIMSKKENIQYANHDGNGKNYILYIRILKVP